MNTIKCPCCGSAVALNTPAGEGLRVNALASVRARIQETEMAARRLANDPNRTMADVEAIGKVLAELEAEVSELERT